MSDPVDDSIVFLDSIVFERPPMFKLAVAHPDDAAGLAVEMREGRMPGAPLVTNSRHPRGSFTFAPDEQTMTIGRCVAVLIHRLTRGWT